MKNKKIYGFVLLALITMLLPIGGAGAKYIKTLDVGTVTLNITAEPTILSPSWQGNLTTYPTKLIVDSFTDANGQNKYNSLNWENGKSVGYDSENTSGFKNNVRLFEVDSTAYILAQGKNPVIFPKESSALFAGWANLSNTQSITFNSVDTSNAKNMSSMFFGCSSLTSLDITSFNTSKVEDMSYMFAGCSSLASLDVSAFDTSSVTNMANMFNGCSGLTSLDVSGFETSNVTDMNCMFNSCSELTALNVSNFDTSNVKNMSSMFQGCGTLTGLELSTFDTSKVTDMSAMFSGCGKLTTITLSKFNTSVATNMQSMFCDCEELTSLDLSSFNTEKVTDMNLMFGRCKKLAIIYASNSWNVDTVTNSNNMFSGCANLKGGNGTVYNSSIVDKTYARIDGGTADPGYLTSKTAITTTTPSPSSTFSLVRNGATITGTQTTGNQEG